MKKRVLALTALSSLLFSAGSLAAPSVDIKVIGELTAPSCDVTMPQNGVIDYGDISHTLIEETKTAFLGTGGGGNIVVKCDAATPLTFRVTDNRLGTASMSGTQYFGFGNVNGTGKLGYYTVQARNSAVDGVPTTLFSTATNAVPSATLAVNFEHGKRIGWARSGTREMAVGKEFSVLILTEAYLAKRSDMKGGVGEGVNLDGSATLEFGFGL